MGEQGEVMLKNWVMALATCGFPVTKTDLLTSVKQIVKDLHVENLFEKGRPGNKWLCLFLKRHPDIAERTVEKLCLVRANVTERFIRNWFTEVQQYFTENDLNGALADPNRVFNMDESAFFLCPKGEKVLGIRGQKNVYEVNSSSNKENLTVLCNINAGGKVAPTLIVFPGQRLPSPLKLSVPEEWAVSCSESGWINGEVFFEYFENIFYKWVQNQNIAFPIIVFIDGHKSHMAYHLSEFCSKNKVVLVSLPPNCTHVIQPLDVAVFHPVKVSWAKAVHEWRMSKDGERLSKFNFPVLLKTVLDKSMKEET